MEQLIYPSKINWEYPCGELFKKAFACFVKN